MTPLPTAFGTHRTNGAAVPHERHWDPAAERLIALARNAHRNVDRQDDVDYWYRLGQRNAYAHAAGIIIGRGVDSTAFAVAERLTAALEAGVSDLVPLRSHALGDPLDPSLSQSPTWLGPVAFRAQYGPDHNTRHRIQGIDHDYGMRWGAAGDQRISLRHPPGADRGLLYAYDPTWDQYAVLSTTATVQAVRSAFAQAVATDPHLAVTEFAALAAALDTSYEAVRTLQTAGPGEPVRQGLEL